MGKLGTGGDSSNSEYEDLYCMYLLTKWKLEAQILNSVTVKKKYDSYEM